MKDQLTAEEPRLIVGIDPGVNTGYAIYSQRSKTILQLYSLPIHRVMEDISIKRNLIKLVRVEDARLRKFVTGGREKLQGVGSVKRDCKIWEDYLAYLGVPFEMVAPKRLKTKVDGNTFKMITGWHRPTNEHARDAGMSVYGYDK